MKYATYARRSGDRTTARSGLKTLASHVFLTGWEDLARAGVLKPQQEEESTVKIFPNPAGDYFMLSYDLNLPGQVQLYDLYGRVRLTQALSMDKRHERISTTHLETGVYIVMVTRQDGSMHNLRLLITR
jgi:hypothetical protein